MLQNQVDHALVKDLEILRKFSIFSSSVTGMDRVINIINLDSSIDSFKNIILNIINYKNIYDSYHNYH